MINNFRRSDTRSWLSQAGSANDVRRITEHLRVDFKASATFGEETKRDAAESEKDWMCPMSQSWATLHTQNQRGHHFHITVFKAEEAVFAMSGSDFQTPLSAAWSFPLVLYDTDWPEASELLVPLNARSVSTWEIHQWKLEQTRQSQTLHQKVISDHFQTCVTSLSSPIMFPMQNVLSTSLCGRWFWENYISFKKFYKKVE